MPKVELEKIRLAVTAITQNIVATIPSKDGITMLHKHDVTSDFLKCIIDYGANKKWNIAGGDKDDEEYEVACVAKKGYKRALYSRKDVRGLLAKFVADKGNKNTDKWIEENLL
jgi:hypothetical protein